jgi:hypothetical protein
MTPKRTKFEKAAAKLISVIQKEWHKERGEPGVRVTELVMAKAQELLSAARENKMLAVLNGLSLTQFLGETWVRKHPGVNQCIAGFEAMIKDEADKHE